MAPARTAADAAAFEAFQLRQRTRFDRGLALLEREKLAGLADRLDAIAEAVEVAQQELRGEAGGWLGRVDPAELELVAAHLRAAAACGPAEEPPHRIDADSRREAA
jgi:hypothetical protein